MESRYYLTRHLHLSGSLLRGGILRLGRATSDLFYYVFLKVVFDVLLAILWFPFDVPLAEPCFHYRGHATGDFLSL